MKNMEIQKPITCEKTQVQTIKNYFIHLMYETTFQKTMKHFLSFCLALCSIVLIALFSATGFPDGSKSNGSPEKASIDVQAPGHGIYAHAVSFVFSPGNLPDRITVPGPIERTYSVKDVPGRERENRELKGKVFEDKNPPNLV